MEKGTTELGQSSTRGARSYATIDMEYIRILEMGTEESRTHIEQMKIDMGSLFSNSFPGLTEDPSSINRHSFLDRMRSAARILWQELGEDAINIARRSASDTVRGWGAFVIEHCQNLTLEERLILIRPFAEDAHFAVREWAWLSVRPAVAGDVSKAINLLNPWAMDPSECARRFAIEITRPRGVWCNHLRQLKDEPWIARNMLDVTAVDRSKYVRDSLGNWLNDASKTRAMWVESVCIEWERLHPEETAYVRRRALRTLKRTPVGQFLF